MTIHYSHEASQPDVGLACGRWTTPAWAEVKGLPEGVYQEDGGDLYTFGRVELVDCAGCRAYLAEHPRQATAHAITPAAYAAVRGRLRELGHGADYDWSESLGPPGTPEELAREHAWVVINSGMRATVARGIMDRVWPRVERGLPVAPAFRHAGKAAAIERVWREREPLLAQFRIAPDRVAWCETLPWIGPITRYHLAKNLGVDVAKPDRWLVRLAAAEGETVDGLCRRLAVASGDRVATVDVVLWRACAVGVIRVADGRISFDDDGARE